MSRPAAQKWYAAQRPHPRQHQALRQREYRREVDVGHRHEQPQHEGGDADDPGLPARILARTAMNQQATGKDADGAGDAGDRADERAGLAGRAL